MRKELDEAKARTAVIAEKLEIFMSKVTHLEAQPAPAKAAIVAVTKAQAMQPADTGPSDEELTKQWRAMTDEQRAHVLMKASLANPIPMGPQLR